jgi:ACR3 family arsenite efflux pump ArsB
MKITFIEKYFWLFLIAGIIIGLWNPLPFTTFPAFLPKLLLGMMLFSVFLKIDTLQILENIRNYKLMIYISLVYMIIIPLVLMVLSELPWNTLLGPFKKVMSHMS